MGTSIETRNILYPIAILTRVTMAADGVDADSEQWLYVDHWFLVAKDH